MQRTLHLHAYSLRKSNITVDFLPERSIPPVTGDAHQLMQVFLNLILNSEQAMREVRDRGTLRIRLEKRDHSVAVTFQDDGPGIPPDILPNIFDPFYTTKRPGRGTGLGLSICKAILREHNGNVEAASGPGGGAVFTVTLPVGDKGVVPAESEVLPTISSFSSSCQCPISLSISGEFTARLLSFPQPSSSCIAALNKNSCIGHAQVTREGKMKMGASSSVPRKFLLVGPVGKRRVMVHGHRSRYARMSIS